MSPHLVPLVWFSLCLGVRSNRRSRIGSEPSRDAASLSHDLESVLGGPTCADVVEGATRRKSSWMRSSSKECKCPPGSALNERCAPGYSRYFGTSELVGKGCSCVDRECGIETVEAEEVLPGHSRVKNREVPVTVATKKNVKTKIPLDFTGIWWTRNNAVPEELVSFAGMTSNTSGTPWFPADVNIPNRLRNMWAWDASLMPYFIHGYHTYKTQHDFQMAITFSNSTHGVIETALKDVMPIMVKKWAIAKLSEDEWSWLSDGSSTLARIVYESGELHPKYWPEFVAHMGKRKLRVFDTDDECRRNCRLDNNDCGYCASCCGVSPRNRQWWCEYGPKIIDNRIT